MFTPGSDVKSSDGSQEQEFGEPFSLKTKTRNDG